MLYLGVDLSYRIFDISAVSNGFTCLERSKNFCPEDKASLKSWIHSFLLSENETVVWFFCEKNFLSSDYASSLLFSDFGDHYHFLVKDRVVLDFYHTVNLVNEAHDGRILLHIPLILALSKRDRKSVV
jgi:hypothetical protein